MRKDYKCGALDDYNSSCTESELSLPICNEKIGAAKEFCGEGMKTLTELDVFLLLFSKKLSFFFLIIIRKKLIDVANANNLFQR